MCSLQNKNSTTRTLERNSTETTIDHRHQATKLALIPLNSTLS